MPYAYELRPGSKTHRCKEHLLSALIRHNVSRLERETKIETYSHAFCGTFLPAVFVSLARLQALNLTLVNVDVMPPMTDNLNNPVAVIFTIIILKFNIHQLKDG